MKEVQCSSSSCVHRRRHYEHPDQPRGPQMISVPDDHPGPWFCSIECSLYYRREEKDEDRNKG